MTSFDSNGEYMSKLSSSSILKLSFEKPQFRRRIDKIMKKSNISNLLDLLSLSDAELEDLFGFDDADRLINLKERFEANPEDTAASLLADKPHSSTSNTSASNPKVCLSSNHVIADENFETSFLSTESFIRTTAEGRHVVFPSFDGNIELRNLEERASRELDSLTSSFDNVMVYQTFDAFNADFDTIISSFDSLFRTYRHSSALAAIDCYFGTIFLIYVSYRSSKLFDGENLWGNFFSDIGLREGSLQSEFKRLFLHGLKKHGLLVYGKEEEPQRYLYSALLHGGLSEWSWVDLWENSILPMERNLGQHSISGELPLGLSGGKIFSEIIQLNGTYSAKERTRKILEKVDADYICPLMESAFLVASQVRSLKEVQKNSVLLNTYDLPDVAMQALQSCLIERQQTELKNKSDNPIGGSSSKKTKRYTYLPMAKILLDLQRGVLLLAWNKQRFPHSYAGKRVDYYVNGICLEQKDFEYRANYALLDRVEIPLDPQDSFEVEIRLMEIVDDDKNWEEVDSVEQVFHSQKHGCFEFIIGSGNQCRLRGDRERILRRKKIAYLVRNGLYIKPVVGMAEFDVPNSFDSIDGNYHIQTFEVEPSASGELIEEATYRTVETWQERYAVRINKRGIVGRTIEGLDAFGYNPSNLNGDCGLPSISITALDGDTALNNLSVYCLCDGIRLPLIPSECWNNHSSDEASIIISFSRTKLPNLHIRKCELAIYQEPAPNKVKIAYYEFAILPIRGFKLSRIYRDNKIFFADYEFQALEDLRVIDSRGMQTVVLKNTSYVSKALLKDDTISLSIASSHNDDATKVDLFGAALQIEVPQKIDSIAKHRPVILSDVLNAGGAGSQFSIESLSARKRSMPLLVLLGDNLLFFKKEFSGRGLYSFNLYSHADFFLLNSDDKVYDTMLTITLYFGDDYSRNDNTLAYGDINVLRIVRGFGFSTQFSTHQIIRRQDRNFALRFNGEALFPLRFDFIPVGKNVPRASSDCNKGDIEVPIPASVMRLHERGHLVKVAVTPVIKHGRLGSAKPLEEFTVTSDM